MPAKFQFTDAADALAHIEAQESKIAKLTLDLATANATAATVATITGERDKARTDLTTANATIGTLTAERDAATGIVTKLTSEKATLEASQKDFDVKVAAALAKAGIRTTAVETGASKDSDKKLTATEKVLAANGVNTLDELQAKRAKK